METKDVVHVRTHSDVDDAAREAEKYPSFNHHIVMRKMTKFHLIMHSPNHECPFCRGVTVGNKYVV